MKSIIDDWNNELNAHSRAFVADAQSLAEWDQHIRRKRRELLEMEAHLNRVHLQQRLLLILHMHCMQMLQSHLLCLSASYSHLCCIASQCASYESVVRPLAGEEHHEH